MKKIAIFFLLVIIIVAGISYMYINFQMEYKKIQIENRDYESYKDQEIYGTELTTIINKAINENLANEVQKDKKGRYINNEKNSINIEIKIIDNDKIYPMEAFYNGDMNKFVQFYGEIKFTCTKLEYHQETGKIKYMLFEQVTQ